MTLENSGSGAPDAALPFGLTGGIACGKSTVAGFFRELGAYVIDADRIGHELIAPGLPAYRDIVEQFGTDVLSPAGGIDRKKLGPMVFANSQQLRRLNAILHPRIIARMDEIAGEIREQNPHTVVILDVPLIYESGMETALRKVIVAWCRPEQQLERLIAKTGFSREEAWRRIQSQMPLDEKRRRAEFQIDCSGSLDDSRAQAEAVYHQLRSVIAGA